MIEVADLHQPSDRIGVLYFPVRSHLVDQVEASLEDLPAALPPEVLGQCGVCHRDLEGSEASPWSLVRWLQPRPAARLVCPHCQAVAAVLVSAPAAARAEALTDQEMPLELWDAPVLLLVVAELLVRRVARVSALRSNG